MLAFPYISPDKYTPHCLVVADDDRRRNDEIFITFMVKVNEVNEVAPSGPTLSMVREVSVPLLFAMVWRGGGDRHDAYSLGGWAPSIERTTCAFVHVRRPVSLGSYSVPCRHYPRGRTSRQQSIAPEHQQEHEDWACSIDVASGKPKSARAWLA